MNKWLISAIAGLIMAILAFLFSDKIMPPEKPEFYKVHYELDATSSPANNEEIMGELPAIIKRRINKLGYTSVLRMTKSNHLDVIVDHVKDTLLLRRKLVSNRRIEFRELYMLNELPSFYAAADKATDNLRIKRDGEYVALYSIISPLIADEIDNKLKFPPAIGALNEKDTPILTNILRQPVLLRAIPADVQFCYGIPTHRFRIEFTSDNLHLYAIRTNGKEAILTNEDIETAYLENGALIVHFNHDGATKWEKMTKENAERYLAIVLDGFVVDGGIIYSKMQNDFVAMEGIGVEDGALLVSQIKEGSLPADVAILKQEISPEVPGGSANKIILPLVVFIITSGLFLLVLNNLKNS
jgi:preprotein translocase subunit SecD